MPVTGGAGEEKLNQKNNNYFVSFRFYSVDNFFGSSSANNCDGISQRGDAESYCELSPVSLLFPLHPVTVFQAAQTQLPDNVTILAVCLLCRPIVPVAPLPRNTRCKLVIA